jgi:hypothetical protein
MFILPIKNYNGKRVENILGLAWECLKSSKQKHIERTRTIKTEAQTWEDGVELLLDKIASTDDLLICPESEFILLLLDE